MKVKTKIIIGYIIIIATLIIGFSLFYFIKPTPISCYSTMNDTLMYTLRQIGFYWMIFSLIMLYFYWKLVRFWANKTIKVPKELTIKRKDGSKITLKSKPITKNKKLNDIPNN